MENLNCSSHACHKYSFTKHISKEASHKGSALLPDAAPPTAIHQFCLISKSERTLLQNEYLNSRRSAESGIKPFILL